MNLPHVSEQVTPQSVHAAIDACNAERARANAQVPELNLPKQPYPDEIEQDHPDEIEQDEPQDEGH